MTDLTTVLFPTASAAAPLAPAAPASVTGVPGMAGQFAQTLDDLLAGTPSAAAPAVPTVTATVPPDTARPLPTLGLVGPLPGGKLLATGITDRQALADDGNPVPAEPVFPLLANPAWRATVFAPATPPRTPISVRTALERAAAQLATPAPAKPARGSTTASLAESPLEGAEDMSTAPEPTTNDPSTVASTPDGPASAPAMVPTIPLTAAPEQPSATPEPTPSAPLDREQGTVAAAAARPPVSMAPAPLMITTTGPDLPAPALDSPDRPLAPPVQPGATLPVAQERTAPTLNPSRKEGTAVPPTAQGAARLTPPATARAPRPLPSDQAILTALGALPNPVRDASPIQTATPLITTALPQVDPTPNHPVAPNASLPPATAAPSPQPATAAPAPTETAPLARATATTSEALAGRAAAPAPESPVRAETMPVRLDRNAVPQIAVSNTPQPAGQVFAAALATAATWRDRPATERTDPAAPTAPLGFTTAVDLGSTTSVQPTDTAQRTPLDLTQDSGVQRMIDHIEVLRDDADSRDTRIRLVPDALGSVDVAVRQVGERIHVSFTAEHEATRALIAEAQPRLTELAAERGVRIAGTSVATDTNPGASQSSAQGQGQPQSQSQPQSQNPSQSRPNAPHQPPRAPTRAQRDAETPEDQRLA